MQDIPVLYIQVMDVFLVLLGIFFLYLIFSTHPCGKFFMFLHGIFILDAYYFEHFPFSFAFAFIAFFLFLMSLGFLRGDSGDKLNQLIEEKIVKRFFCKN